MALEPLAPGALAMLRARTPRPHQASHAYEDAGFRRAAVRVLPGEYFVWDQDILITTTLGSCVAACLHDREAGIGGMNHFMLPDGPPDAGARFGLFAMEILVNEMIKAGARRDRMRAKVFGGGQVMRSLAGTQIGERNVAFVGDFLGREGIAVIGRDVLGVWPRRICQFPRSGEVLCKRLPAALAEQAQVQEEGYRARLARTVPAGEIEIF